MPTGKGESLAAAQAVPIAGVAEQTTIAMNGERGLVFMVGVDLGLGSFAANADTSSSDIAGLA
jgi:hypothetical protein